MIQLKQLILESDQSDQQANLIRQWKRYRIPYRQFNQGMKPKIQDLYTEYDGDVREINERVARWLLYRIAEDLFDGVEEIDFRNQSKHPTNHFQMDMNLGDYMLSTSPFIHVNDKHQVVANRTRIEILDHDYETIVELR